MRDMPRETIEKAALGDMDAFEEIYKAFSSIVYTVAFNITHDRQDAEEVTQNVFVKVFRALKSFNFESAFGTWIYRIAMNTAITLYRSRARYSQKTESFDETKCSVAGQESDQSKDVLDRQSAEAKVARLLEHLTPEHRSCIVLRELEGLDYKEIAAVLRIPINIVRSWLKRAREALVAYCSREGVRYGL